MQCQKLQEHSCLQQSIIFLIRNLQGEKIDLKEEDEPSNVVSGAYEGVKGYFKINKVD